MWFRLKSRNLDTRLATLNKKLTSFHEEALQVQEGTQAAIEHLTQELARVRAVTTRTQRQVDATLTGVEG